MNRKLSRWVVAGAAALAMTLSACSGSAFNSTTETAGGSASAASEIMIGALHPLTGSNAADGQQMANAAKLGVAGRRT